jgi:hypothetical protein
MKILVDVTRWTLYDPTANGDNGLVCGPLVHINQGAKAQAMELDRDHSGLCESDRQRNRFSRRSLLKAGTLGALGLSLPELLRSRAAETARPARASSVLLVYAQGGISHHDSFDPKPQAPAEVRGEFKTIATRLSGLRFSDRVPLLAERADRYTLIRSMWHRETDHGVGSYYVLRGYVQPDPTFDRPENQLRAHPNIGSQVARLLAPGSAMPPYMVVPGLSYLAKVNYYTAGWMGRDYDPFVLRSDPNLLADRGGGLVPLLEVDAEMLQQRLGLLQALDSRRREFETSPAVEGTSIHFQKACELLLSGVARQALDLRCESRQTRDAYGRTRLGQSCLLGRRLVEAGVPFVTVDDDGWDHHGQIFRSLENQLPVLDRAFSALLDDLDTRGLLDTTLVLLLTEFGRTPVINKSVGRDHWPRVFSIIVAGAGIPQGQVLGASDRVGGEPIQRPITPKDVAATIYSFLGLDPFQEYASTQGRPFKVLDAGEVIREL